MPISEEPGLSHRKYRARADADGHTFSFYAQDADRKLTLLAEDADAELVLTAGEDRLEMHTIAARCDCIVNRVQQSKCGLLRSLRLSMAPYRDIDSPQISWQCETIPVVRKKDGPIRLHIDTDAGSERKIGAIIMNAIKGD